MRGVVFEVLKRADAAVVCAVVWVSRLAVEVREGEDDVRPVLLEHGVGLVDYQNLDGGQEVIVKLFGSVERSVYLRGDHNLWILLTRDLSLPYVVLKDWQ